MSIFVLWGVVVLLAGVALVVFARRQMRTRPGWNRLYSPGGLLLSLGVFVALGGVVNVVLGLSA